VNPFQPLTLTGRYVALEPLDHSHHDGLVDAVRVLEGGEVGEGLAGLQRRADRAGDCDHGPSLPTASSPRTGMLRGPPPPRA